MKKCIAFIGAGILTAWTAAAADVPKVGVYLGYEYVRFNSATDVPAFSANGGGGQFIYNFNGWLGAVADVGAVHNGNMSGLNLDSTFTNFLFGPRISIRRSKRITPYFQVLWGGVYGSTSTQVTVVPVATPLGTGLPTVVPGQPVTARLVASQTAFAMTAGGGLDIKISRHVSFRPIGLDYYLTRLQNLRTEGDNTPEQSALFGRRHVPVRRREAYAAACGTSGTAHQDLPGRPRGECRCGMPEAGYHAGRQRHVAGSVPGGNDRGNANPAKRSERIELHLVRQRTAGQPGSDFHFRHRRPPTGRVQGRVDGQWQQFQPGVGGHDDHGS